MRLREKLCCSIFFFLTGARCSNHHAENDYLVHERGRGFDFFPSFSGSSPLFLGCCCAVLCFFFRTYGISKEGNKYPTWGMYVRMACSIRVVFLNGAWSSWH